MLLCRFCPFMICLNGGARGLCIALFFSIPLTTYQYHSIQIRRRTSHRQNGSFFFRLFLPTLFFFFSLPFSSFLPHSSSLLVPSFLPPFRTSLPFPSILHQSQFLYVRIAAPERKETREPRWGSRINFMLERAP